MKIIKCKHLPFHHINVCGLLFVRGDAELDENTLNHERIHSAQMREMNYLFYYLWWVIEWLIRCTVNPKTAHHAVCFEQEATECEVVADYLETREPYAWMNYYRRSGMDGEVLV